MKHQALLIARNESALYPDIIGSVSAILFLATPHRGSTYASYATILSRIAEAITTGSQVSRITGAMRTDLLKSLRTNEDELLRIAEDFRVHTSSMKITSFLELKKMQGLNDKVRSNPRDVICI